MIVYHCYIIFSTAPGQVPDTAFQIYLNSYLLWAWTFTSPYNIPHLVSSSSCSLLLRFFFTGFLIKPLLEVQFSSTYIQFSSHHDVQNLYHTWMFWAPLIAHFIHHLIASFYLQIYFLSFNPLSYFLIVHTVTHTNVHV